LAAPLIGEQLRNFGAVPPPRAWKLPGLLQDGCPAESFPLAPPLGAVLEKMFTGLDAAGTTNISCPGHLVVHWAIVRQGSDW